MNEQTEVREDWLIELEELELEAVVGGTGIVTPIANGAVDGVGELGIQSGNALNSEQMAINALYDGSQAVVGKTGSGASTSERNLIKLANNI